MWININSGIYSALFIHDGKGLLVSKEYLNKKSTIQSFPFAKLKYTVSDLCRKLVSYICTGVAKVRNVDVIFTTMCVDLNSFMNIRNSVEAIKDYISAQKVHESGQVSSEASVSGASAESYHVEQIEYTKKELKEKTDSGLTDLGKENVEENGKSLVKLINSFVNDCLKDDSYLV